MLNSQHHSHRRQNKAYAQSPTICFGGGGSRDAPMMQRNPDKYSSFILKT